MIWSAGAFLLYHTLSGNEVLTEQVHQNRNHRFASCLYREHVEVDLVLPEGGYPLPLESIVREPCQLEGAQHFGLNSVPAIRIGLAHQSYVSGVIVRLVSYTACDKAHPGLGNRSIFYPCSSEGNPFTFDVVEDTGHLHTYNGTQRSQFLVWISFQRHHND